MARFGKLPVSVPEGVTVSGVGGKLVVKGPKGELARVMPSKVKVDTKDGELTVTSKDDSDSARALQGTIRSHILNMIHGVTEGWAKALEIEGAGYRAEVSGKDLVLNVGYSHPVTIAAPEGISFGVEKNVVTVSGADKEVVGQIAADIRKTRTPNVYTGSGIKYQDEEVRRKAGKQAASAE